MGWIWVLPEHAETYMNVEMSYTLEITEVLCEH
jgi:hypothetical protein